MPLHRKVLQRMPSKPNLAALSTLVLCLVVVILPMTLLSISLVRKQPMCMSGCARVSWISAPMCSR